MHVLIFGLGYSGAAIGREAAASGHAVTAATRQSGTELAISGLRRVGFEAAQVAVAEATHVVSTVPPDERGDPVLRRYGAALRAAPGLRWLGYMSTTGLYGDRGGGWVDEHSAPAPGQPRSARRLAAEQEWRDLAPDGVSLDLLRTAGIYGPGRSALDDVRAGRARRIVRPGHLFGRIHRDDIAGAVLAAAAQDRAPGPRILHLSDSVPASSAEVVAEAARLLDATPPPQIAFDAASMHMSEMARSFWAENRRVDSRLTQRWLGRSWQYPSFREGLRAILAEERR